MGTEEVFTYLFVVSSVHIRIRHSVQAPSLPVQVQNPPFHFLSCSLTPNTLFVVNFIFPTVRKGGNAIITHKAMALQNLFVLKRYSSSCFCSPLILLTHDVASSIPRSANTGFQRLSKAVTVLCSGGLHMLVLPDVCRNTWAIIHFQIMLNLPFRIIWCKPKTIHFPTHVFS